MQRKTLALLAFGICFAAGAVAFARSKPATEVSLPKLAEHPAARHDLVDFRYGPTLRASSSAFAFQHHPAFLVDGAVAPTTTEKWVSDPAHDHAPWVELSWGEPKNVDEVALTFAGAYEGSRASEDHYSIRCLGSEGHVDVTGNTEPRPRHPIACAGATGLRVDFGPSGPPPRDSARVYEIEVFGQ